MYKTHPSPHTHLAHNPAANSDPSLPCALQQHVVTFHVKVHNAEPVHFPHCLHHLPKHLQVQPQLPCSFLGELIPPRSQRRVTAWHDDVEVWHAHRGFRGAVAAELDYARGARHPLQHAHLVVHTCQLEHAANVPEIRLFDDQCLPSGGSGHHFDSSHRSGNPDSHLEALTTCGRLWRPTSPGPPRRGGVTARSLQPHAATFQRAATSRA